MSRTAVVQPVADVLVVDDDPRVATMIALTLEDEGYHVRTAADGASATAILGEAMPDVVVLDLMLPDASGFALLTTLRRSSDVPIIVVSARDDERDRIRGLDLGADDYVVKPVLPRELAARVRAVCRRRVRGERARTLAFPGLEIDTAAKRVRVAGTEVELRAREFDLLAYLAASPGTVFSTGDLLTHVWHSSPEWQDPGTVTEHVRRLRRKLEPLAGTRWIHTVRGAGYRFEP